MTRRITLLVLALLSPALAGAQDAVPVLPDFTKAPYRVIAEKRDLTLEEFPELGIVTVTTYATSEKMAPGQSAVHVVTRRLDGVPGYAEWQSVTDDGKLFTRLRFSWSLAVGVSAVPGWVFQGLAISPVVSQ